MTDEQFDNEESLDTSEEKINSDKKTETSTNDESTKTENLSAEETAHAIDNDEAKRIKNATVHKLTKRHEQEMAQLRADYEQRLNTASNLAEEEKFDPILGAIPKDLSIDEYRERLEEKAREQAEAARIVAENAPIQKNVLEMTNKIQDFEPVMSNALQSGLLNESLGRIAAKTQDGLHVLYDLVKANSPKLIELSRMTPDLQAIELGKLIYSRNNPPNATQSTKADVPLKPVEESQHTLKDYASMDYDQGYAEYKKRRRSY
jgi:hypothetical protein